MWYFIHNQIFLCGGNLNHRLIFIKSPFATMRHSSIDSFVTNFSTQGVSFDDMFMMMIITITIILNVFRGSVQRA